LEFWDTVYNFEICEAVNLKVCHPFFHLVVCVVYWCIVVCTVNGESTVMGSGDGPAAATVISAGTASSTVSNGGIKCDSQQQQHSNAVIGIVTAEVLCVCIVLYCIVLCV